MDLSRESLDHLNLLNKGNEVTQKLVDSNISPDMAMVMTKWIIKKTNFNKILFDLTVILKDKNKAIKLLNDVCILYHGEPYIVKSS